MRSLSLSGNMAFAHRSNELFVDAIRRIRYPDGMTETKKAFFWGETEYVGGPAVILGEPGIDSDAPQPDSEELAATYERRALAMEQEAADASTPAQAEGHRLGASSFRRKAAAMRERMGK